MSTAMAIPSSSSASTVDETTASLKKKNKQSGSHYPRRVMILMDGFPQGIHRRGAQKAVVKALKTRSISCSKVLVKANGFRHLRGFATLLVAEEHVPLILSLHRTLYVHLWEMQGRVCIRKLECLPSNDEYSQNPLLKLDEPLNVSLATGDKRDHLFPVLSYESRRALRMDSIAIRDTTDHYSASRIVHVLYELVNEALSVPKTQFRDLAVVDTCACIGGLSMALARRFPHVLSHEIDKTRFELLQENLQITRDDYNGVTSALSMDYRQALRHGVLPGVCAHGANIVMIDPPWGGSDYSKHAVIEELFLSRDIHDDSSSYGMKEFITELASTSACQVAALRLPKNYDFDGLAASQVAAEMACPGDSNERPFPFRLSLGSCFLMVFCYPSQISSGSTQYRPLQFSNAILDSLIARLNALDVAYGKELKPAFFDFEANRFIRLSRWKGCKMQ